MAKKLWQPNNAKVGDGELIGRRIYFDSVLNRQLKRGQEVTLRMDHFWDSRLTENLSVDRLTQSGSPNRKVMTFLRPLAEEAQSHTEFYGWGALKVKSLRAFRGLSIVDVLATPVANDPREPDNPYHADISRDGFRQKKQAYALAMTLAQIANDDVGIVGALGRQTTWRSRLGNWCSNFLKNLSNLARKQSK